MSKFVKLEVLIWFVSFSIPAQTGQCDEFRTQLVADMEGETVYYVEGNADAARVSITTENPAQGKRCLRFECTKPSLVVLPVYHGAGGFNAVAFDVYCWQRNGATFRLNLKQEQEGKDEEGRTRVVSWNKELDLSRFTNDWTSVRVVKDIGLRWSGNTEPDWGKVQWVRFYLGGQMNGKCVVYFDNIRFEKAAIETTANMLYNSSFEMATNPDVPDGWYRWKHTLCYEEGAWQIDTSTAYHGKRSIRIGADGRSVVTRVRPRLTEGQDYTFSVYLKSNGGGTRANLFLSGLKKDNKVEVTTEWQRYTLTGKARQTETVVYMSILDGKPDDVLWVDAAQLEPGITATPYALSVDDTAKLAEMVPKRGKQSELGAVAEKPSISAARAVDPPVIDGRLTDSCWKDAPVTTPFVRLEKNEAADPRLWP